MQKIDGCNVTTAATIEDILENISLSKDIAIERNLRQIHELKEWREQAPIAIVGGGPSLKDNIKELKQYKSIIACGSVHDFLIENGWPVVGRPQPSGVPDFQNVVQIHFHAQRIVRTPFIRR